MSRSAEPNHCAASEAAHTELLGLLDAALARLSDADRRVLVLRFYEKRSFPEIGQVLGTTDESARKRVNRSIDRLRSFFARRGSLIATGGTVAIVSAALSDCASAAPPQLVLRASTSVAGSTAAGTIASAVARRMLLGQLQKLAIAACASICISVLAGIMVHSILLHHDRPAHAAPVAEERDHQS